MKELNEGDRAPAFKELGENKGKTVVLYFYPKDNTPGCTTEACELRDAHKQIANKNAVVLGVSPDSAKSHEKFSTKFDLPFTLGSRRGPQASARLTAFGRKSPCTGGNTWASNAPPSSSEPTEPSTKIFHKVKPAGHAEEVLAAI